MFPLNFRRRPAHCYTQFALDEVAAALHQVRGQPRPRPIVNSIKLRLQFPGDFTAKDWPRLERELDCLLPALENGELRRAWETVFDLAAYLATKRVELDPPRERTLAAWRNSQVFAGVRDCMVEQLALQPYEVFREARFVEDLHCD
jgi:hypothetical protein